MDADNADLKRSLFHTSKEELPTNFSLVLETAEKLKGTIQVNPREINLFYIEDNIQERIILTINTK
jgi:hypothetical protein